MNPDNDVNLENKEIQAYAGINNEYVPFGNFIIEKPTNEEVKQKTNFTGYDYMIKFNIPYENRVTYPVKATVLFQDICNQAGVEVGNTEFINSEYLILGNPFTNGEDCRTVLSNIAQLAGGFAKIGRDNKIYIKTLKNIGNLLEVKDVHAMTVEELNLTTLDKLYGGQKDIDESIDGNNYFTDFTKNERWGEVNSLVLRLSGTEGENTVIQDDESIEQNGLTEIVIEDNYFLINQQQRENVINPIWSGVKGLKYTPFKTQYYGFPYIDAGDLIYILDNNDTKYISYVLNHTFKYNGSFSGSIETPATTKTQTSYKNVINAKTKFAQTERKIDKINGIIEDLIVEQTEMSQRLSQHTQDIGSITDTIKSTMDFEEEVEETNELLLQNCVETNPLSFIAYAENVENITTFDPNLKFAQNLYPKFAGQTITVVIDTQSRANPSTDKKEYYFEINPLRKFNNVSDEFVIECIADGNCTVKILRYITKNGNTYTIRETPQEEILATNIDIRLFKYTNYIYLKEYTNWKLKANYITNPNINEYYASQDELSTQIRQTEEAIQTSATRTINTIDANLQANYATKAVTATSVDVEYALGTSTSTAPVTGWSTTAPTWENGKYMWQRTTTNYADGTSSTSNPTCIAGAKGQDGTNGTNGTNGVGISSITEYYAVSSSNSSAPSDSSFSTSLQTMTSTNKYLWNYELITYTNNTTSKTSKRVIGVYGDKGQAGTNGTNGTNGIGISSIANKYAVSSSNTTAPTSWSNTPQTMTSTNKYLWNYEIITYTNNTTYSSTPAVIGTYGDKGEKGATGANGTNGTDGDDGIGVSEIIEQYYLSTSNSTQTGGSWQTTQPTWVSGKYIWTRSKITWTDNTTTYTTPILASSINKANETANNTVVNFGTYIEQNWQHIKVAWNQISQYMQLEGINGNAVLNIYDNNNDKLMTLSKDGLDFYNTNDEKIGSIGVIRGTNQDTLAFSAPVDWNASGNNTNMAWGIIDPSNNFLPIFYLDGYTGAAAGEYYGEMVVEGKLSIDNMEVINDIKLTPFLSSISWDSNQYISTNMDMQGNYYTEYVSPSKHDFYCNGNLALSIKDGQLKSYNSFLASGNAVLGSEHDYSMTWSSGTLILWVDQTAVVTMQSGNYSDMRLKEDIKDIDDIFLKAIDELPYKQFRVVTTKDKISFGIIAQDLIKVFKKYNLKASDYKILGTTVYDLEDKTQYYTIDYEQFLILKQMATDKKIKNLEQEQENKNKIINDLIKRIEALEKKGDK